MDKVPDEIILTVSLYLSDYDLFDFLCTCKRLVKLSEKFKYTGYMFLDESEGPFTWKEKRMLRFSIDSLNFKHSQATVGLFHNKITDVSFGIKKVSFNKINYRAILAYLLNFKFFEEVEELEISDYITDDCYDYTVELPNVKIYHAPSFFSIYTVELPNLVELHIYINKSESWRLMFIEKKFSFPLKRLFLRTDENFPGEECILKFLSFLENPLELFDLEHNCLDFSQVTKDYAPYFTQLKKFTSNARNSTMLFPHLRKAKEITFTRHADDNGSNNFPVPFDDYNNLLTLELFYIGSLRKILCFLRTNQFDMLQTLKLETKTITTFKHMELLLKRDTVPSLRSLSINNVKYDDLFSIGVLVSKRKTMEEVEFGVRILSKHVTFVPEDKKCHAKLPIKGIMAFTRLKKLTLLPESRVSIEFAVTDAELKKLATLANIECFRAGYKDIIRKPSNRKEMIVDEKQERVYRENIVLKEGIS